MGRIEDAIMYATKKHEGQRRKSSKLPYIMHPLEVATIIATMTEDEDAIIAGLLHDVVEDTNTDIEEIATMFGTTVAKLVSSETENKYTEQNPSDTWKRRKMETLAELIGSDDIRVKMLWLGDKLANIRSMAAAYETVGESLWEVFHQHDPKMHEWYYRAVAEAVEPELGTTDAFDEFKKRINQMWG